MFGSCQKVMVATHCSQSAPPVQTGRNLAFAQSGNENVDLFWKGGAPAGAPQRLQRVKPVIIVLRTAQEHDPWAATDARFPGQKSALDELQSSRDLPES
jgi:hypothetical protein